MNYSMKLVIMKHFQAADTYAEDDRIQTTFRSENLDRKWKKKMLKSLLRKINP